MMADLPDTLAIGGGLTICLGVALARAIRNEGDGESVYEERGLREL